MLDNLDVIVVSQPVLNRLQEISRKFSDLSPAMLAIGEVLTESTKQRFTSSTAPDGSRWTANAQSTVLGVLNRMKGAYNKSGKISAKGVKVAIGKKPLVATGILQDTITYKLLGDGNGVEIGTNRFAGEWAAGAAVHQWGSTKAQIPARPFLGLSDTDVRSALEILDRFAESSAG